jgi:hypothetical protein
MILTHDQRKSTTCSLKISARIEGRCNKIVLPEGYLTLGLLMVYACDIKLLGKNINSLAQTKTYKRS